MEREVCFDSKAWWQGRGTQKGETADGRWWAVEQFQGRGRNRPSDYAPSHSPTPNNTVSIAAASHEISNC